MAIILSHPTGNANVRAAARGLAQAGLLTEFHTSIASFPGNILDKLAHFGPLSELRRRQFDPMLERNTRMWPWKEVIRLTSTRLGFSSLITHETGRFSVDAVYHSLDKRVARRLPHLLKENLAATYAYEDGALNTFKQAKKLRLKCNYDMPIGYWRTALRLLEIEIDSKPEWAATLVSFQDSERKHALKDEELRLADRIFVASKFTADTLKDFPGKLAPIEVIPYGFPPATGKRIYELMPVNSPLKLLFVGGLSQRKGIAELFAAVETLKEYVELTVVGQKVTDNCPILNKALAKHRWIPSLPHTEILKLMQQHDVLVFPSLFEGFGLVITEAMSQGTPVITTHRTAGPDLIEHGNNGWLVEPGSSIALQESIANLIGQRKLIAETGKAAMQTAICRPWDVYGKELAHAIRKHLNVKI